MGTVLSVHLQAAGFWKTQYTKTLTYICSLWSRSSGYHTRWDFYDLYQLYFFFSRNISQHIFPFEKIPKSNLLCRWVILFCSIWGNFSYLGGFQECFSWHMCTTYWISWVMNRKIKSDCLQTERWSQFNIKTFPSYLHIQCSLMCWSFLPVKGGTKEKKEKSKLQEKRKG